MDPSAAAQLLEEQIVANSRGWNCVEAERRGGLL
jgi:hypothetical protein